MVGDIVSVTDISGKLEKSFNFRKIFIGNLSFFRKYLLLTKVYIYH